MKTHSFIFPFLGSLTSTPISIFFWETLVPHHTTDAGENYEPWPFIGRSEVHATCTGISWSFYKLEHTEKRQTILLWVQASGWVWDPSDLVEEIFPAPSRNLHVAALNKGLLGWTELPTPLMLWLLLHTIPLALEEDNLTVWWWSDHIWVSVLVLQTPLVKAEW